MEVANPPTFPPVTLFDTHARTLTSKDIGIEYSLSVWLPPNYANEQKTYPVVYVLDGNTAFGASVNITLGLVWLEEVPPVIIVGIGVNMTSYDDWLEHRGRDYDAIPDPDNHPEIPGGAIPFLEFFEAELIPFIEANYRADPTDRIITGYSLSAHFVLYALVQRPGLFRRYIAGAPAISAAFQAVFHAGMDPSRRAPVPAKLAILVGDQDDGLGNIAAFWRSVREQQYAGLDLKTFVLAGEKHITGGPSAYIRGLMAVFS